MRSRFNISAIAAKAEGAMKNRPLLKRLGFAFEGIVAAWKSEASFRSQIVAAVISFVFFLAMGATPVWWALWAVAVTLVLAAELFNTALELLIDTLHPDVHPRLKVVKDCAAGAVLVLSFSSLAVLVTFLWARLLGPLK
jgi:diacylglycerol kinase (ATP)